MAFPSDDAALLVTLTLFGGIAQALLDGESKNAMVSSEHISKVQKSKRLLLIRFLMVGGELADDWCCGCGCIIFLRITKDFEQQISPVIYCVLF